MAGTGIMLSLLSILVLFFYLFILVLPVALLVALQVWLCRKSLRLGLILPGLSLAISLLITLIIVFNMVGAGPRNLIVLALVLLVCNIPTVVYGGIWLHYKGRKETLDDLKRMRIEDLE